MSARRELSSNVVYAKLAHRKSTKAQSWWVRRDLVVGNTTVVPKGFLNSEGTLETPTKGAAPPASPHPSFGFVLVVDDSKSCACSTSLAKLRIKLRLRR